METTANFDLDSYRIPLSAFNLDLAISGRNGRAGHALTHLEALESESIHILREVAAECRNPVLLFSGGKDSLVLLRLAEKAFRPARFPFPLIHIDTGHNFPAVIEFRDCRARGAPRG